MRIQTSSLAASGNMVSAVMKAMFKWRVKEKKLGPKNAKNDTDLRNSAGVEFEIKSRIQ
jgi:hypothetical protein